MNPLNVTSQLSRGGEAFTIQFYEAIKYLVCLGRQPNLFTENTLFNEIIHYIEYNNIVSLIDTMDPSKSVKRVNIEISK